MRKCAENHLDEVTRSIDDSRGHAFRRTLCHPAHIDSMNLLHVAGGAKRSGWVAVWTGGKDECQRTMRTRYKIQKGGGYG